MNKPGIVEFAQKIGVSPTTVSRSISGRGRISESTRKMVLQRMKELGYVPNVHAQSLISGRSRMMLLHATGADMGFVVQMAEGIQTSLSSQGYGLVLDTTSGLDKEDSLIREWVTCGAVDGAIVITGTPGTGEQVAGLINPRTPVVTVGYASIEPQTGIGVVIWDLHTGANQVADALVEYGHKRIGFIDIGHRDPVIDAFRHQLSKHGVELDPDLIVLAPGVMDLEDGMTAMNELLGKSSPPTAVFARNDVLAIGAIRAAKRAGLAVPHDISIVGHDDLPIARFADPLLTTVRLDYAAMGRAAAETVFALLEHPNVLLPPKTVDCTSLVPRETAGPARAN